MLEQRLQNWALSQLPVVSSFALAQLGCIDEMYGRDKQPLYEQRMLQGQSTWALSPLVYRKRLAEIVCGIA